MRKCPNPSQSAARQGRIDEIRILLLENQLTTGQIHYLTGINKNTLTHYMGELEARGYVTHKKDRIKGCQSVNLYRITADGRSVKPAAPPATVNLPVKPANLEWWQINLAHQQ